MSFYLTHNEADIIHYDCLVSRGLFGEWEREIGAWMKRGEAFINKISILLSFWSLTTAYMNARHTKESVFFDYDSIGLSTFYYIL